MPNFSKSNFLNNKNTLFYLIFFLLLSVYFLTFNGFPVSDDEHIFAGISQSLVSNHSLNPTQVYGNSRISGFYEGIGPLHSIIGALFMSLFWKTNLGLMQSLYLLNPIYTAATGAFIFLIADRYNYKKSTSILSALIFGLTTIAWPYTQTFYREPLAMLLITISYWLFEKLLNPSLHTKAKNIFYWTCFLIVIVATFLTKIILIVIIPFYIIKYFQNENYKRGNPNFKYFSLYLFLGFIFFLIVSRMANQVIPNRFSLQFVFERAGYFWENLTRDNKWFLAILGVLFSPMKGLFIYSPIFFFLIPSSIKYWKKNSPQLFFYFGTVSSLILIQAVMYQDEWWNISWGTRFLIPILPLLILACLPMIEEVLSCKRKIVWFSIILISLLGFIMQLGRILIADVIYLEHLYTIQKIPDLALAIWRLDLIPIVKHWEILLSGALPNLASFRTFSFQPKPVLFLQFGLLFIISISLLMLFSQKEKDFSTLSSNYLKLVSLLLPSIIVLMLRVYSADPLYRNYREDFKNITFSLYENIQNNDLILIDSYLNDYWYYFFNFGRLNNPWYGLYPINNNLNHQITDILRNQKQVNNIWLVSGNLEQYSKNQELDNSNDFLNIACWIESINKKEICLYKY